jgi:hypothetical protein
MEREDFRHGRIHPRRVEGVVVRAILALGNRPGIISISKIRALLKDKYPEQSKPKLIREMIPAVGKRLRVHFGHELVPVNSEKGKDEDEFLLRRISNRRFPRVEELFEEGETSSELVFRGFLTVVVSIVAAYGEDGCKDEQLLHHLSITSKKDRVPGMRESFSSLLKKLKDKSYIRVEHMEDGSTEVYHVDKRSRVEWMGVSLKRDEDEPNEEEVHQSTEREGDGDGDGEGDGDGDGDDGDEVGGRGRDTIDPTNASIPQLFTAIWNTMDE